MFLRLMKILAFYTKATVEAQLLDPRDRDAALRELIRDLSGEIIALRRQVTLS